MAEQIAEAWRGALRKAAEAELARLEKERAMIANADEAVDDIIAWLDTKIAERRLRKRAIGFKDRRKNNVDTRAQDTAEWVRTSVPVEAGT